MSHKDRRVAGKLVRWEGILASHQMQKEISCTLRVRHSVDPIMSPPFEICSLEIALAHVTLAPGTKCNQVPSNAGSLAPCALRT